MRIKRFDHSSTNEAFFQAWFEEHGSNDVGNLVSIKCECATLDCGDTVSVPARYSGLKEDPDFGDFLFFIKPEHFQPLVDSPGLPIPGGARTVISFSPPSRLPLDIETVRHEHERATKVVTQNEAEFNSVLVRLQAAGPAAALALGLFVSIRPEAAAGWTFAFYASAALLVLIVLVMGWIGVGSARRRQSGLLDPWREMPLGEQQELESNPFFKAKEWPEAALSIDQLEHLLTVQGPSRRSLLSEEEWLIVEIRELQVDAGRQRRALQYAKHWEGYVTTPLVLAIVLTLADAIAAFLTS